MPKITTLNDVRTMMQRAKATVVINDDDAVWFCALIEADNISSQMSRKDLASLVLSGMPAMTKETIEGGWLSSFYWDDWEETSEEERRALIDNENVFDEFGSMIDWKTKLEDYFGC